MFRTSKIYHHNFPPMYWATAQSDYTLSFFKVSQMMYYMCILTGFRSLHNRYISNVPDNVIQRSPSSSQSAFLQCARHVFTMSQKCNPAAHQMYHTGNSVATFQMSYLMDHTFSSPAPNVPILNDFPMSLVVGTFFGIFHNVLQWSIRKELVVSFRTLFRMSQRGTCLVHRNHPLTQDLEICLLCCG